MGVCSKTINKNITREENFSEIVKLNP